MENIRTVSPSHDDAKTGHSHGRKIIVLGKGEFHGVGIGMEFWSVARHCTIAQRRYRYRTLEGSIRYQNGIPSYPCQMLEAV